MGNLRAVPKVKEPGFIQFRLEEGEDSSSSGSSPESRDNSNISVRTRFGTEIRISREVPLKQIARLVRMLEGRSHHGLG